MGSGKACGGERVVGDTAAGGYRSRRLSTYGSGKARAGGRAVGRSRGVYSEGGVRKRRMSGTYFKNLTSPL